MDLKQELRQHEEDLQRVRELRLLDDDFMTMVFDGNIEATELLLNIIFGRTDMVVTEVIGQREIKNVNGRSVILDILAKDDLERYYDIEVQRDNRGANAQRSRFNIGMLDTKLLKPSQKFEELADAYVIFITENDVIGAGLPLYHVERCIIETKAFFKDGSHIIYVNGAYENETDDVGKLMHDFRCRDASQMHFKVLAEKVRYLKETSGGQSDMGNVFDDIRARSEAIGEKRGEAIGEKRGEAIGEKKGEAAGVKRGSHDCSLAIAERLIRRGKETYAEIAELTGLPLEEVSSLAQNRSLSK